MRASLQHSPSAGFVSWKLLISIIGGAIAVCLLLVGILLLTSPDGESAQSKQQATTPARNPLHKAILYVDPYAPAAAQAAAWRTTRPADAALMDKLAALPSANWIGIESDLDTLPAYIAAAAAAGKVPLTVAYNIPERDCGLYSKGGAANPGAYRAFIDRYAAALGTTKNIVIVEPDAVAYLGTDSCLNASKQQTRYELLQYAIATFKKQPNTVVYLDGGNSAWKTDVSAVAEHLRQAGALAADGFSLNVSNFRPTSETLAYGKQLSERLDDAHFVIDTSRNGNGAYSNSNQPAFNWCNPPDRALGHYPTTATGVSLVDAYLYIKVAGESDGQDPNRQKCFGGPAAGEWWPEYALGLIQRWPTELQPPTR